MAQCAAATLPNPALQRDSHLLSQFAAIERTDVKFRTAGNENYIPRDRSFFVTFGKRNLEIFGADDLVPDP
jgi:hypothetical protein